MEKIFENIKNLVGNTPLLEIEFIYKGEVKTLYAKDERYNLTGSIKDRMAYYVLKKAYERGEIKKGDYIVEATSGNTGIAFSALGTMLGHNVVIFMPQWMSDERKKLLKGYGAHLRLVTFEEGGFAGSVKKTLEFKAENPNTFLPRQFANKDNVMAHYHSTAQEILSQFEELGIEPTAVVVGVGTGGTIMGITKGLREKFPNLKSHPLEPLQSPIMSKGIEGDLHRIEGIGDGFIPEIVNCNDLNTPITVDDADAILMAQKLGLKGLGFGISSGANFLGAIRAMEMSEVSETVVTVFPDDNKKYLTTDLMKEVEIKEEFLSKDVEIIKIVAHK